MHAAHAQGQCAISTLVDNRKQSRYLPAMHGATAGDNEWSAARIKALRTKLGTTQEHLAREIGVTVSIVCRWENGHAKPSPLARQKLSALEGAAG